MNGLTTTRRRWRGVSGRAAGAGTLFLLTAGIAAAQPEAGRSDGFRIEEATIEGIHRAIQDGRTSCLGVVQAYVDRARAYNGACTQLVTLDGAPVAPASGPVRAGVAVRFPTSTVPASSILPDLDRYAGMPLDLGRMEPTLSDPTVQAQYGMVAGVPDAGQVNALSTLNLRGERSVSCKAGCDAHPSTGELPADCPAACDAFRRQPDALERAAELDAQYGSDPDLAGMPMYCIPLAFKDVYDTADMRTTTAADIDFARDAPPADATIVARLRSKGGIIYAKANATEFNGGIGNPGGSAASTARYLGYAERSTWGGQACNPYDTERSPRGSSSGSGVAVSANLAVCAFCEQTGGSCKGPASRNGVVSLLTTKGLIPYGGAVGSNPLVDRAGLNCRTVKDAALVLDALADPALGYFDPRDIYTALPQALASKEPYASFVVEEAPGDGGEKPLAGMRIGIVREYMVEHTLNDAAISDRIDDEVKTVLRDRLGASLVESVDPLHPDDPAVPDMAYSFQDALAEILPIHMPEYFHKTSRAGALEFAVPGHDVTSTRYLVELAEGRAPARTQPEPAPRDPLAPVAQLRLPHRPVPGPARRRAGQRHGEPRRPREVLLRRGGGGVGQLGRPRRRPRLRQHRAHADASGDAARAGQGDARESARRAGEPREHPAPPEGRRAQRARRQRPGRVGVDANHHRAHRGSRDRRAGRVQRCRLRAPVRPERGRRPVRRGPRLRTVDAGDPAADQPDVLGRPRRGGRGVEGGVCLRGGDSAPSAASRLRPASRRAVESFASPRYPSLQGRLGPTV